MEMYSGGLGVLAGDHLKAASDLGLPLVAVGLLYQQGYFHQYLNADGWQQELYPTNDFHNLPIQLERDSSGAPITVQVDYPGRSVSAQIWRVQVGRVALYMLDANIEANRPEDRAITAQLYGGDLDMRIRQEILLGIGGMRALRALGIEPTICHMNDGHPAFLALERIRMAMQERGISFAEARTLTMGGNVFTTHTPVPAGIDLFPPHFMDGYFGAYYQQLGISRDEFWQSAGRGRTSDENLSMPSWPCALRAPTGEQAPRRGGPRDVAGTVAGTRTDEVPSCITNGVHPPTGSPATWPACCCATWGRVGPSSRRIRASGIASTASPTRSCGTPTSAGVSAWWPWPANAWPGNWPTTAPRPAKWPKRRRCSIPRC